MKEKKIIVIFGISSGIGKYLFEEPSINKKYELIGFSSKKRKVRDNIFFYQYKKTKILKNVFSDLAKKKRKVHIIICNGTNGEVGRFENINFKKFLSTFDINFFSSAEIIFNYLNFYKKKKKFILVFSGGGAFGNFPRFDSYACSKTALVRLVENLAAEYKKELQINAIAPGFNYTKIQEDLLKNNTKKNIGENYYNFIKRNKYKNNFEKITNFLKKIISDKLFNINGKTISINFDEWEKAKFRKNINIINKNDFMCLRRINQKPY